MCRSRWFLPLFALVLGGALFAAQAIGGHPGSGLVSWGIMAALGALFLFGGRSETIRGLRGDGRDERFRMIDVHATAFSGTVLIGTLIVLWAIEVARGHDGNPYGLLSALAGIAYLVGIAFMRWRS
jgi:drug/metabolite transporter (DMT)-like permease